MHLGLEARAQVDELRPVADQLPELPKWRRADVGLGKHPGAQQVGQGLGVAAVVLQPLVGERLDAERVGQVHPRPHLGEAVRHPVPAVGGLEDHLRPGPGLGDLALEREPIVIDADLVEHLTALAQADDDRAATVQVDADVLCHWGLLPPRSRSWFV